MTTTGRQPIAAIIGTGMIAEVHRRAISASGAEVRGVLASTAAKGKAAAERWGPTVQPFDTLEELLKADVDVVHVASPNFAHCEQASSALRSGKHVICEKPLGLNSQEADEMTLLAESTGLIATVPFTYRYHPIVRELRTRRLSGELGDLLMIHGSYLQDWMLSPSASNWRVDPALGGASRAFADIGSHLCDMIEWVSGEKIQALSAITSIAFPDRSADGHASFAAVPDTTGRTTAVETEDVALVIGVTDRGTPVSLTVSQVSAGRKNRLWFELDGTNRSAVFDQEHSEFGWIGDASGGRTIVRGAPDASPDAQRLSYLPAGHAQGYQDCFNAFIADTYAAIRGETLVGLPTFADGARSSRIVDALLTAAHTPMLTPVSTPARAASANQVSIPPVETRNRDEVAG